MHVRQACPGDIPFALGLAASLGLNYPGMEFDPIWVAEESGKIVGLVALKEHPEGFELCSLGVDPGFRHKGTGKALVEALLAEAPGDVHLMTVIPEFFETCGFHKTPEVPATFSARRKTSWCEGCRPELCTIMLRGKL